MTTINIYIEKFFKKFEEPISYDYDKQTRTMTVIGRENRDSVIKEHVFVGITYYSIEPPTPIAVTKSNKESVEVPAEVVIEESNKENSIETDSEPVTKSKTSRK